MASEPTNYEAVISALQLEGLPQEEQDAALVEFSELVFKSSIIGMFEQMNESERTAFNDLVENGAPEEKLQAFLDEHVPNSEQIVKEVVDRLLGDILSATTS